MISSARAKRTFRHYPVIISVSFPSHHASKTKSLKLNPTKTSFERSRKMRKRRCCSRVRLRAALSSRCRVIRFRLKIASHLSRRAQTNWNSWSPAAFACHQRSMRPAVKLRRISLSFDASVWWISLRRRCRSTKKQSKNKKQKKSDWWVERLGRLLVFDRAIRCNLESQRMVRMR